MEMGVIERALREKFDAPLRTKPPAETFRYLLAFWPHFALHKRRCNYSKNAIVSIYPEDCAYPVWHREKWVEHANPPQAEFDFTKPFYSQLWELFRRCPIPHNNGLHNENCEYADDWWHSKNCYLGHSGYNCEDCRYCYRAINVKDSQYCVFVFDSQLSTELVYCNNCFAVIHAINSRNCHDAAFLFDCRDCSDCLCCWNLRHKRYCIENVQYTKDEYLRRRKEFDLSRRSAYDILKRRFHEKLRKNAFWKAREVERCESVTGAFLDQCRNLEDCYFVQRAEDCALVTRAFDIKSCLEVVSPAFQSELLYCSALVHEQCYDVRRSLNIIHCRYVESCAHCLNCNNCFACCGLVGKEFCVLNKQYSPDEYRLLVQKIRSQYRTELAGQQFFPAYFAPNTYDESFAGVYMPLSSEEQKRQGFRVGVSASTRPAASLEAAQVPDSVSEADKTVLSKSFWDEQARRPFRISEHDLRFAKEQGVPLPNSFYLRPIRELLQWIPYSGELRESRCASSGAAVMTNWPAAFDSRILSEEEYERKFG